MAVETLPLPVGEPAETGTPEDLPRRARYEGRFVRIRPLEPGRDADELHPISNGPERDWIWTYLPYGPFADPATMTAWLERCAGSSDPLFLAVADRESDRALGVVSFMSIVPVMRRLELGHIWYAPTAHRTEANTEAVHLMLCEAFDRLRYRRVEWKCDAYNERSRRAATRLGFRFEGIFRQHVVVKGRNRDTAWFSMLDREWPRVKANMEQWLDHPRRGSVSLTELNAWPAEPTSQP